MAGGDQGVSIGELDPVDPLQRQDSSGCAGPVDLRNEEAALSDQIFA